MTRAINEVCWAISMFSIMFSNCKTESNNPIVELIKLCQIMKCPLYHYITTIHYIIHYIVHLRSLFVAKCHIMAIILFNSYRMSMSTSADGFLTWTKVKSVTSAHIWKALAISRSTSDLGISVVYFLIL